MNRWDLKIILKNGQTITGYVKDDISNSNDIFIKYFGGESITEGMFNGIKSNDGANLLFRLRDVSAVYIRWATSI